MSNTITIQPKQVYGHIKYYPVCDKAIGFSKLIGQKTLTKENLKAIKELGYNINLEQPNLDTSL